VAAIAVAARIAYGVPAGIDIVAAPGTQMLIQLLPRLAPPGPVAIVSPTYNEHAAAWAQAGHETVAIAGTDSLPTTARHVVIVNPNNPDGRIADHATLARIAAIVQQRGGWLVIDEAFADLAPGCSAVALCRELPVLVLRSFGKFYGLAGLRLGFVIGMPELIARCTEALGPWCCSGPALAIGRAALDDQAWAGQTRAQLHRQASLLDAVLSAAGFTIVGGTALYRLARHREAAAWHEALARRQIWCRRFDWADDLLRFGLPADDAALRRLADALAAK